MKKALMIVAAVSMGMAQAQSNGDSRSPGSAKTALNFHMAVVPGCAVDLNASYDSAKGATYNGTDKNPATVVVSTYGKEPNFRCQTGTRVTIKAETLYGKGNTFVVEKITDSDTAPTVLDGKMSLALDGFDLSAGTNNDDKTLEGEFVLTFGPGNVPGGNGDIYSMLAAFKPKPGQFEPTVGNYKGTLNVTVSY
ncbi:hypothetical protein [Deinococcus koreensis]|nr:hypothetical protein [Deinococcus koreensis]